jgi:hypothetical protein
LVHDVTMRRLAAYVCCMRRAIDNSRPKLRPEAPTKQFATGDRSLPAQYRTAGSRRYARSGMRKCRSGNEFPGRLIDERPANPDLVYRTGTQM